MNAVKTVTSKIQVSISEVNLKQIEALWYLLIFACKSNRVFLIVFAILPALSVSFNYVIHKHAFYSNYWRKYVSSSFERTCLKYQKLRNTLMIFLTIFLIQIQCSNFFSICCTFLIVFILSITKFTFSTCQLFCFNSSKLFFI